MSVYDGDYCLTCGLKRTFWSLSRCPDSDASITNVPATHASAFEWFATPTVKRIVLDILPVWIEQFNQKAKDYQENHQTLGARGQFADIWRKIAKLKRGMWDGEPLVSEQVPEIIEDLIGHCFLALDEIDRTGS